jgi:hypothetical protein
LNFLKRNKVPALLLVLTSFLFYFLYQNVKHSETPQTKEVSQNLPNHKAPKTKKNKAHQKRIPSQVGPAQDDEIKSFSYKEESQRIRELIKKLPQSESQLIAFITKEDYFKAHFKEIKPHSFNEITQNQMGALKVLALKALVSQKMGSQNIQRRLNIVIQKAKDPTIVNIAKAALESTKKERPFFKDFADGIEGLAI